MLKSFQWTHWQRMCVGNNWFKKKNNRNVTFNGGFSGTEIDFVLMNGSQRKFLKDVGAIGGGFRWKIQQSQAKNRSSYVSNKKKTKGAVAEAMKNDAVNEMKEIRNDRNVVFRRMVMMKKEASDRAGNNCIKDKNGKIVFAEDGRKRVWKEQMEAIMNQENPWDGIVNVEVVEGTMEPV